MIEFYWSKTHILKSRRFVCGYCSAEVASKNGYAIGEFEDGSRVIEGYGIYLCPSCKHPTFFSPDGEQKPNFLIGDEISHLPKEIGTLYEEARQSFGARAYTGVALLCRKLLMNLAVQLEADKNLKFIEYVDYLKDENYIPKYSRDWVDHIRKSGNLATHEIGNIDRNEAEMLLKFTEMLLKITYEYPSFVKNRQS
ncbi:DUF4145 domain-containing protein [uncultured Marinococcus sp.]|uniref:DUF4145 domain-containing protein n=1 Tax=uncultured Marinococcus sp. TaxID=487012 RepID=UPI0026227B2B|nr:DUF4145 domain-containing protein [uncultured Marinococcus sp.]